MIASLSTERRTPRRARTALAIAIPVAFCALVLAATGPGASGELAAAATGGETEEKRVNPCAQSGTTLRCPDLVMSRPRDLKLERTPHGRALLRSTTSIDSIGDGPMTMDGRRIGKHTMSVRQRIHYRSGKSRLVDTDGRLDLKYIPGQGPFWKFRDAARMELWTMGEKRRRVRTGPKLIYCFRDYKRTRPSKRSPRWRVFPACSQNRTARRVRLGTSVGWSDVYGAGYHEQWVDVSGLRGCFALWHIADPKNHLFEKSETNNSARTVVRLPFRGRAGTCRR